MSTDQSAQAPPRLIAGSVSLALVTVVLAVSQILNARGGFLSTTVVALVAICCIALTTVRWRWPIEVFVLLLVLAAVAYLVPEASLLALWIWAVAAFIASCWVRAGRSQWAYVSVAVLLPGIVLGLKGQDGQTSVAVIIPMVAASAIGFALRNRALLAVSLAEREELQRQSAALATQTALAEERTRIARDLHDSLAQSLAIISAQADGAGRLVDADPQAVAAALDVISRTSRKAQAQVRETVFALRDSTPLSGATLAAAIEELVARVGYSGVSIQTTITGELAVLPDAVAECVFLVAREAVTNVMKYADGDDPAQLGLAVDGATVRLSVTNQLGSDALEGSDMGNGIVSMRERLAQVGGRLEVVRSRGSFSIVAQIPSGVAA